MKIFFDTNVIISSFITHGGAKELFEHCMLNHKVFTSKFVIEELKEKLESKFYYTLEEIKDVVDFIKYNFTIVNYNLFQNQVCKDRDDDNILASAQSAKADCIVTGDKDLLALGKYENIFIVSPKSFWRFERNFTR